MLIESIPKDSWLHQWVEAWPLAESPKSYIIFTGLYILGACLGRRIYFNHDVHTLWPMLNLLFIGPSGIGKSTAIDMGLQLLNSLPFDARPAVVKGAPTPEKLHADLAANPHALLVASELANFFNKQRYMEGLVPYVTELLDYSDYVERRTKTDNIIVVKKPSVAIIGASTVAWLQDQLPESAGAGGFLARFLMISESFRGQRMPLPSMSVSRTAWIEMLAKRAKAFNAFYDLLRLSGEVKFRDYGAADTFVQWALSLEPPVGYLAPFAARASEFVLRLCLLVAASCGRKLITQPDVKAAIKLYEYSFYKLQKIVVPFTPQGKLLNKVLEALGTGSMHIKQLNRAMRHFCTAQDTYKLVTSLLASGDIVESQPGLFKKALNGG